MDRADHGNELSCDLKHSKSFAIGFPGRCPGLSWSGLSALEIALQAANSKWVQRQLEAGGVTSGAIRTELLARRLDFGILRSDRCPEGLERFALKPIPMCLLLPSALVPGRRNLNGKMESVHRAAFTTDYTDFN